MIQCINDLMIQWLHLTLIARLFFLVHGTSKDPITRSWVIIGDELAETPRHRKFVRSAARRRFRANSRHYARFEWNPWSARSVVHPQPLYHIEGEAGRRGEGLYDRMMAVGAHEVLVETQVTTATCGMYGCGSRAVSSAGRVAHSDLKRTAG